VSHACRCEARHTPRLVVVTGGPGAGKTAALEVVRRELCRHVAILPEAARVLWTGGFPRLGSLVARTAAQRAIARVQLELQTIALEHAPALVVCDRGTLDGLAYWPGDPDAYLASFGSTRAAELARYELVIHLRPPSEGGGYTSDDLRPETALEAAAIDARIAVAWAGHPRIVVVDSDSDVLRKLARVVAVIRAELPACCA